MKRMLVLTLLVALCSVNVHKLSAQDYIDGLYRAESTGEKKPMPLPIIREADVMWEKTIWREIDLRQKINQGFYFPITPHNGLMNLYDVLFDAIKAGTITAYEADYDNMATGEIKDPISYNELMKKYIIIDEDTVTSVSVERFRIKEKWYFDKQRSQLLVRIIAIAPVTVPLDDNGDRKAPKMLFWVPYDDQTRTVLAKSPFYNRNNSSNRLSYDEVFLNRMFDSYIYREDNIYDRSIVEYADGVEALMESERIKQEIINKEQFLWEY